MLRFLEVDSVLPADPGAASDAARMVANSKPDGNIHATARPRPQARIGPGSRRDPVPTLRGVVDLDPAVRRNLARTEAGAAWIAGLDDVVSRLAVEWGFDELGAPYAAVPIRSPLR